MKTPWQPIHTFNGEMFSIMSNGIPDSAEVVKYKGDVPAWAKFWMPLPAIPKELLDAPFIPHEQNEFIEYDEATDTFSNPFVEATEDVVAKCDRRIKALERLFIAATREASAANRRVKDAAKRRVK